MLTTNFNKMTDEEKHIVVTRLAVRIDADEAILRTVISEMNPVLNVEDDKVLISKYTLGRLDKKIREYTAQNS